MNKEIVNLGLIASNLNNFDMSTFDGRLTLQKTIYLLQTFGIYVGYDFTWYIRGPYCSKLASNGFALQEVFNDFPKKVGRFTNSTTQNKFKKFLNFMKDKKHDPDRLEIIASIHFLKTIHSEMSKSSILDRVQLKQPYFTMKQCNHGWDELKREKLI